MSIIALINGHSGQNTVRVISVAKLPVLLIQVIRIIQAEIAVY